MQIKVTCDAGVASVRLARPDALNALTVEMLEQLGEALADLSGDPSVRVVVISGDGRAFSAGIDLKVLGGRDPVGGAVGDEIDVPGRRALDLITTMPQVVIAKVNGYCFTGALELVLACDLVVVSEDAVFGDTHVKWGLRPSWGMSQRLIRIVGVARARELTYTARRFTGSEAAAWGLAVAALPPDELDEAVEDLSARIVENSAGAIAAVKDLYRAALDCGLADGLRYEAEARYEIDDTAARLATFQA
jgi:enoyl-CoA hydratase/carnithine racemase